MKKYFLPIIALICVVATSVSCHDSKSYAELLNEENQAVNSFLVRQRVIDELPADNNFEVGEHAPYYRIDDEGNVYMQVLSLGTDGMAEKDQRIYFRFNRYNLFYYIVGDDENNASIAEGNADNMNTQSTFFLYDNTTVSESYQYGTGIQMPLKYLPIGSKINLVIKSQVGPSSEISYVQPYLYNIAYYKSMI